MVGKTTLHQGDCLDCMRAIQPGSVDMIFADPPFNVGKKYGDNGNNDNRVDYYDWCSDWIEEGFKLLKPTGSFYLMTIARHVFKMGCEMEKHGVFINKIEWRNVSGNHNGRGFWPSTQTILLFGKTSDYKFNRYAITRRLTEKSLRWGGYTTEPKGQLLDYWDDIPFVYAGSIAHPEAILRSGTNKKEHPAQMPVALASRCILFSTDPGDIVLDPFNGSGTTGEACIKLERIFIGIEKEPKYVQMALDRWSLVKQQLPLFEVNQ